MEKKKGLKDMTLELLEKVEKVKEFDIPARLTVTDLARKKDWRSALKVKSILEVMERSETVGVLVEKETFDGVKAYIYDLETTIEKLTSIIEELETKNSMRELIDSRPSDEGYLGGKELKEAALKLLEERSKEM